MAHKASSLAQGLSAGLEVGPKDEAIDWYTRLLGRPPEFSPAPDTHEWELSPRAWLMLTTDVEQPRVSPHPVRVEVADFRAGRERLREAGIETGPPRMKVGVIIFADFEDPWGNRLGIYQDLTKEGGTPAPEEAPAAAGVPVG